MSLPQSTFAPLQRTAHIEPPGKKERSNYEKGGDQTITNRQAYTYPCLGTLLAQLASSTERQHAQIQAEGSHEQQQQQTSSSKHCRTEVATTEPVPLNDEINQASGNPPSKRRRRSSASHSSTDKHHHHDRSFVHHEYHDYSGLSSAGPIAPPILSKKGRGGVSSMFPTVLHHMLDEAEKNRFNDIVSWQPHGRAFHVHQPDRFVKEVMPNYFRHTRFSSFQVRFLVQYICYS
jgi:hypothetical protein